MLRTLGAVVFIMFCAAPLRADEGVEYFESRVRPVLLARCVECHGDKDPEAKLQLTSRDGLLAGGKSGPAAIHGDPDQSLLIQAIEHRGKLHMPPDGKLRQDEIQSLRHWIELGLPWPAEPARSTRPAGEMVVTDADRQHWAFQPIADPSLPSVATSSWPATSVDWFILARLEAAGLTPSPPTDRRTLIRRAYHDLIGLPPTWDEVRAFEQDASPDAYARVVDRLLASPRYGERWGRHWLDLARYADTKDGVLMYGDDRVRPYAYTYRDYVIRAFNEDLPFDQFVADQLAADQVLPAVDPWRLAAMGFLTLGRMYDNNVHDIIDDQIDTVTRGFLGLTVACARCHDHKYDPIPTADYYSLYGVFASSEVPQDLPRIQDATGQPAEQEFETQTAPLREELRKMLDEQHALLLETARQRVGDYLVHVATTEPDPLETAIYFLSLAPEDLRPPITAQWRRLVRERATADDPVFGPWHDFLEAAGSAAPSGPIAPWKTRARGTQPGQINPLVQAALAQATCTSLADVARMYGELLKRVYEESRDASLASGRTPEETAARNQLLDLVVGVESPAYFPRSQTRRYMSRQQTDQYGGKLQELDRLAVKSPGAPARAMVVQDSPIPYEPCIFVRGNPTQRGKRVPRQPPAILQAGSRQSFPHGSGRLDLARAITSPGNTLTARVLVNRVWMHHFGEPLVSTPSDFGKRSTPPTHPELLDHLASVLVQDGWSLKRLHRRIMLSSTYRQTSTPDDAATARAREIDHDNRLLWRMPDRRLEFEAMRDTLLAVSGRLTHHLGGRPVDVANNPLLGDRTIYGLVDRQSLPGLFRSFDFASPDQSIERRSRTMVPQQALFALNAPFMIEQVKSLCGRMEIAAATEPADKVTALYRTIFARDPQVDELAACQAFVATAPEAGSQLSAWEQLAQVLLASNELMYLD